MQSQQTRALPLPSSRREPTAFINDQPWRQPLGESQAVPEPGAAAEQTHLALFLLLGGFFALLLSLAEPAPERARVVLDSLTAVFSTKAPGAQDGSGLPAADSAEAPRRRAQLPLGEPLTAAERAAGLVARVRLAGERLFADTGEIPRWHWFLLHRLAQRVAATSDPRQLEILVPAGAWQKAPEATERRLEALIARLVALGAARDRLLLGILPEERDLWTLLLREPVGGRQS